MIFRSIAAVVFTGGEVFVMRGRPGPRLEAVGATSAVVAFAGPSFPPAFAALRALYRIVETYFSLNTSPFAFAALAISFGVAVGIERMNADLVSLPEGGLALDGFPGFAFVTTAALALFPGAFPFVAVRTM